MIVCDKKEWKSVRSVDMSNADDTCPSLCAKPSDPEKGKWDCGEAELDPHFGLGYTHPHKKGPVMKNYTRHLTSFSMVIYQAEHNLWCPVNVGWENFAQLQKFQVK